MNQMKTLSLSVVLLFLFSAVGAAEISVPGFDTWKLSGPGRLVDATTLEVTGRDGATSAWRSPNIRLRPGGFYRYSVSMRGVDSQGGCIPCGLDAFSRDYRTSMSDWKDESFCF